MSNFVYRLQPPAPGAEWREHIRTSNPVLFERIKRMVFDYQLKMAATQFRTVGSLPVYEALLQPPAPASRRLSIYDLEEWANIRRAQTLAAFTCFLTPA